MDIVPRAAVLEAFRQVAEAAIESLKDCEESSSSSSEGPLDYSGQLLTGALLERKLSQYQLLPPEFMALFGELRRLRNQAAHEGEIDEEQAKEYLILAELLIQKLRQEA